MLARKQFSLHYVYYVLYCLIVECFYVTSSVDCDCVVYLHLGFTAGKRTGMKLPSPPTVDTGVQGNSRKSRKHGKNKSLYHDLSL